MIMDNWRIIKDKKSYDHAMNRLLELADTDLKEGTPDFDEFELLSLLIGHYEENNFPVEKPDPIEAIKFRMDQMGLTQADMRKYLGSPSKVSEVLNYRRPLSLTMIKSIHTGLGIPVDILIQDVSNVEWEPLPLNTESFALAIGRVCEDAVHLEVGFSKTNGFSESTYSSERVTLVAPSTNEKRMPNFQIRSLSYGLH
nr:transcriptional regulator [Pantoea sp. OVA07A]